MYVGECSIHRLLSIYFTNINIGIDIPNKHNIHNKLSNNVCFFVLLMGKKITELYGFFDGKGFYY